MSATTQERMLYFGFSQPVVSLDMLHGHRIFFRHVYLLFCPMGNFTVFFGLEFGEYMYMNCIELPSAFVI